MKELVDATMYYIGIAYDECPQELKRIGRARFEGAVCLAILERMSGRVVASRLLTMLSQVILEKILPHIKQDDLPRFRDAIRTEAEKRNSEVLKYRKKRM